MKPTNEDIPSRVDCTLNIIEDMKFEIAVQLFSNVDRQLNFKIDLANNSVTPDDVTLAEIESSLQVDDFLDGSSGESFENDIGSQDNNTISTALVGNMDEVHANDFTIIDSVDSDDDSDFDPNDFDSDNNEDTTDAWNVVDIETRTYTTPNQIHYIKTNFLTKVHIERMMELGGYVSKGYQFSRKDRRKNKKLRDIHRKDAVALAVRHAHLKLMTGECTVKDCNYEDDLLQDASQFCSPALDELKKGWGRRYRMTEGGTYGKKYITKYKDEIKELFDKGNIDSSHKMNPAMIREYLTMKYPLTYSLPGETEIKQQINAFVQNKKTSRQQQTSRQVQRRKNWEGVLEEVVRNDQLGAPEKLYDIFIENVKAMK